MRQRGAASFFFIFCIASLSVQFSAHGTLLPLDPNCAAAYAEIPGKIGAQASAHALLGKKPPVAFYGGSFDPPTKAHIAIMRAAMEKAPENKLVVFVNAKYGTKDYFTSFEQRVEMIRAGLGKDAAKVEILADWEIGYEALMPSLREKHREVYEFIGEDILKRPDNRARSNGNLKIFVVGRPSENPSVPAPGFNKLNIESVKGISSSRARGLISEGHTEDLQEILEPAVIEVISRDRLYQAPQAAKLAAQETDYRRAFAGFKSRNPGVEMQMPEFNPKQSPLAWDEKFRRYVEKLKSTGGKLIRAPGIR